MMKDNSIKKVIIGISLIVGFILIYLVLNYFFKKESTIDSYLKNYKVNEYISSYVTDEDMARIYLNDYIHTMYSDVEEAYKLLDEEYKNKRFGSIDSYKTYVNSLNYSTYVMDKYYKKDVDGYIIFGVYDRNGNFFAFKTNGVMQYTVYLDEDTVEIW